MKVKNNLRPCFVVVGMGLICFAAHSQGNLFSTNYWNVQAQTSGSLFTYFNSGGIYSALFQAVLGQGSGGTLSQSIPTTVGSLYQLDFRGIQFDGTNHSAFVQVNGAFLSNIEYTNYTFIYPFGLDSNTNYQAFSFQFLANSNITTVSFFEDPTTFSGGDNTRYFSHAGIDSMAAYSLAAPEPSALALLGVGLAGWVGWRRGRC